MTRGSTILLRLWGALLIAAALVMGPLPIFTFGLMAFAALFVLWLQGARGEVVEDSHAHWVNGVMMLLCVAWFLLNIAVEIARVMPFWDPDRLMVLLMALAFVFPPLIMHGSSIESGAARAVVKGQLAGLYAVALGSSMVLLLVAAGALEAAAWIMFPAAPLLLVALITVAAVAGARRPPTAPAARGESPQRRYWLYILLAAAALLVLIASVLMMGRVTEYAERLSVVMRSLPVLMLFMASYYERRFEFFDVFVKKSTLFFVLLLLLFGYFLLIPPLLAGAIPQEMVVWVHSLTLLPLAFAIPWLSRRIEGWLDRAWLGRKHTTAEAVGAFLDGIAEVTTEEELVAHAESCLAEVFQASVRILLSDDDPAPEPDAVETVAIPPYGHPGGEIRMGPRAQQSPYFRHDLTLLHALAEAFSYVLANLRLQERRRQQDQREQELILDASRAQLKALRAQINPHFLFNALNTIAGLIPGDPERAETTVEQLAEVFRYVLRRSEAEWVRLADELDFVASYLEVEKARFGDRLRVSLAIDPGLRDVRIPTMTVQTLVENALKHGLAAARGEGRLRIEAARRRGRIEISVADNGPGPGAERSVGPEDGRAGYGLENVRRRLRGYYGDEASVALARDEAAGRTIATLTLPAAPAERP